MPIALMYHDVVEASRIDASGVVGAGTRAYKLDPQELQVHMLCIAGAVSRSPVTTEAARELERPDSVLLTFDDGGVSCHESVAELLEAMSRQGHFFIPTDRVGLPGFMTAAQIRSLRSRGHIIGSHSCSHPIPMWKCEDEEPAEEWSRSRAVLEDILGESVTTASVPGGFYSRRIARVASSVGIRVLFTSEPTRAWAVSTTAWFWVVSPFAKA
jgi:peptidoglycan/xylan/chitin deacetylase (PgdA/CDA1 family)